MKIGEGTLGSCLLQQIVRKGKKGSLLSVLGMDSYKVSGRNKACVLWESVCSNVMIPVCIITYVYDYEIIRFNLANHRDNRPPLLLAEMLL